MIRKAKLEDINDINILLEQVLYVHHLGRPDIFKETGVKYTEEELTSLINNEDTPIFVYVDNGIVVGHIFCRIIDRKESSNAYQYKTLYIDDLCVLDSVRGKGVGTSLYKYVKEYALNNDFHNITLHAWECNKSGVEFYKHLGMEIQQYTFEDILK